MFIVPNQAVCGITKSDRSEPLFHGICHLCGRISVTVDHLYVPLINLTTPPIPLWILLHVYVHMHVHVQAHARTACAPGLLVLSTYTYQ